MSDFFTWEFAVTFAVWAMGIGIGYPIGWLGCSRFRDKLEGDGREEVAKQLKELNANLKAAYDANLRAREDQEGGKQ